MKRWIGLVIVVLLLLCLVPSAGAEQTADGMIEAYLSENIGEGLYLDPRGCCDDPYVGVITDVSNGVVYVESSFAGDNANGAGYYIDKVHYLYLQKEVRAEQGVINWPIEMGALLDGYDWVYLEWADGAFLSGYVIEVNDGVAYLADDAWGKTTLYVVNLTGLRYFRPLF